MGRRPEAGAPPSPPALVHAALGAPAVVGGAALPAGATCWLCGWPAARGLGRQRWQGANFVGQNRVRCPASPWVCEPCAFVCAGRPPATLRAWSHLWDEERGYRRVTWRDRGAVRAALERPARGRWFAALAASGQKHVLPWTPLNAGAPGAALLDELLVRLPAERAAWTLVDEATVLLSLGATRAALARGAYPPGLWRRAAADVRAFEARWGGERGSPFFTLATQFLAGGRKP